MLGAIAGDIIGSVYEGMAVGTKDFPLFVTGSRFTDDTVLTIAVAAAIRERKDFSTSIRDWGRRYPAAGYGGWFYDWLFTDDAPPYNSFGNGSAMRVAAVGWAYDDPETVLREATRSAEITHNHPEGIKGARAVAAAILLGRSGRTKKEIAALFSDQFGYNWHTDLEVLRERQGFDVTCQGTVPVAAAAFLQSTGFEDAVRNAVSIGGDTDTLACITGALAEAYYGCVPVDMQAEVFSRLDKNLLEEVMQFAAKFNVPVNTSVIS